MEKKAGEIKGTRPLRLLSATIMHLYDRDAVLRLFSERERTGEGVGFDLNEKHPRVPSVAA